MNKIIKNQDEVYTFDANYNRAQKAAIHIVVQNKRAVLFDSGTNYSYPDLAKALATLEISLECVDYLFLTHVHLDHAGGAGRIMQSCPNAKLVIHQRGARHINEPSKLMAGTQAVYGVEKTKNLYGELIPVPLERMIIAEDLMEINWQGRSILILDTPGHARHHLCFYDKLLNSVFTGDVMGISYREMDESVNDNLDRQFVFTTTTPTQFEPSELKESINKILALNPKYAYLAHYGQLRYLQEKGEILINQINELTKIAQNNKAKGEQRYLLILAEIEKYLLQQAHKFGSHLQDEQILNIWQSDLELDAQGLVSYLDNN